ncbi:MAG: histidinol-phosphatase HisJ family protein [Lachnospiraceae bacterium]
MFDLHMHSDFSTDSESSPESMIEAAIHSGLSAICFTDHLDMDFPAPDAKHAPFLLDTPAYFQKMQQLKDAYRGRIEILIGVELGLQPHLADFHQRYLHTYPFDFVIGSSHLVHGEDPYEPAFFSGREESEAYTEYFQSILDNLSAFTQIDVYGHLDYVVRYGPNQNQYYSYTRYRDLIDAILQQLIRHNIGLEINTGGYKYGLGEPNPCAEIIRRYIELGGETFTIGADAHEPSCVGDHFAELKELLIQCGVRYIAKFKNRQAAYFPIEEI